MKTQPICPNCQTALSPSPVDKKALTCRNLECKAIFETDLKGNVITDAAIV